MDFEFRFFVLLLVQNARNYLSLSTWLSTELGASLVLPRCREDACLTSGAAGIDNLEIADRDTARPAALQLRRRSSARDSGLLCGPAEASGRHLLFVGSFLAILLAL